MSKKHLVIIGLILIAIIGLPLTLYIFNQQQELRGRAQNPTSLTFAPHTTEEAPRQIYVGDIIPLDIMIHPGSNAVSLVKLEILFDQSKFEYPSVTPFEPNLIAFSQVVDKPLMSPGKLSVTLNIGTDLTKVVTASTRVGTLKLRATNPSVTDEANTLVKFGPGSQVLAVGANTNPDQNVLSSTTPAIISIDTAPVPTCSPRPSCLSETPKCLIPEPSGGWCPVPAPTTQPTPVLSKCPDTPSDSIIIIDRSGSMKNKILSTNTSKLTSAKEAATRFVDIISGSASNRVGLITFSTAAKVENALTNDYSQIKNKISNISPSGYTCHHCAVTKTNEELTSQAGQNTKKIAILLTDGKANRISGNPAKVSQSTAEQKTIEAIKNTSVPNNIVFYTIGLGNDINENFLKQIAELTGGKYYDSPTSNDLMNIYEEITNILGKGSINGFVFNDANQNSIFDQNETKLSGWTINLLNQTNQKTTTFISNATGEFNITGLCDSAYSLSQKTQTGWTQTVPINPDKYAINISMGNAVSDKIFGNIKQQEPTPTPTQAPQPTLTQTSISIKALLDGIGSRGDNTNPDGSQSNKDPKHPERNIKISFYNTANQLVTSVEGKIKYASASGAFLGDFQVPTSLPSGNYTSRASTANRLIRLLPGIQTITSGARNILPDAIFTAGDIVQDNKLDIKDYNALIDCYSDLAPATSCSDPQKKIAADLNDDGNVNQFDYNLFLREIATQPGQ